MCNEPIIVQRNKDVEHIMHASCYMGVDEQGRTKDKQFAMLVTSDIHECPTQLSAAIDYLNYYEALDCGICLGDIQQGNYAKTDGTWYYNAMSHTQKPFMSILGNHDVGNTFDPALAGSPQMAFDKFIRATAPLSGIENFDKPHFIKLFDQYKIAIIGLNPYGDYPDLDENGRLIKHTSTYSFMPEEVDWFIDALKSIPQGYHLTVAVHGFMYDADSIEGHWTDTNFSISASHENAYGNDYMICDIIDAWIKGTSLVREYPGLADYLPTLSVNCDFSERGEGVFISYIVGHYHRDAIGRCRKYPDQKIICFPATANDRWQSCNHALPRQRGTKAEDAITVMSIVPAKRQVRLVRVGSNITIDFVERKYIIIEY